MDAQRRPGPGSVTLNMAVAGCSEMSDDARYSTLYDQLYCFNYFSEETAG